MNTYPIKQQLRTRLAAISLFVICAASFKISALAAPANSLFSTEEILDESTLDIKILEDWHPVGSTRQKLIEINVAEWWPGQDYRIPVRMIVPLEGKAKGFSITGANPYETLLKPPESSHKVEKDKLKVRVSFDEGPQPTSGRIWWMYDRAPAGSAPFLHIPIPEDQWADMERDPKPGSWTATIPLKEGASRVDFFSNHGHMANGYQQYLSSPYTRVELSP